MNCDVLSSLYQEYFPIRTYQPYETPSFCSRIRDGEASSLEDLYLHNENRGVRQDGLHELIKLGEVVIRLWNWISKGENATGF